MRLPHRACATCNQAASGAQDAPGAHAAGPTSGAVPAHGTLRVLLIRAVFADQQGVAPISEADARTLARQAGEFFARASCGALELAVQISPAVVVGPLGAYPAAARDVLRADAWAAVQAAGTDPAAFDLDVVYSRGSLVGNWGRIGRAGAWVTAPATTPDKFTAGLLIHELGHNLGLQHARAWRTQDGSVFGDGAAVDYGHPFDTMGGGGERLEPFSASARHQLGWLPEAQVAAAAAPGVFRLLPADTGGPDAGAARALRLRLPGSREFWIETRTARPTALLVQAVFPGHDGNRPVLVNTWPGRGGGYFDAPLPAGRSLLDAPGGLRITPRLPTADAPPGALDVEVRRVHHGFHEADAGAANDAAVEPLEDATEGRAVRLAGPETPWPVPVSVPAAGDYQVWLRVQSTAGMLPLRVTPPAGSPLETVLPAGPGWRWHRIETPPEAGSAGHRPALVSLPAGESVLHFSASAEAWLDLVLLTDDESPNLPPYLAVPSPVRLPAGAPAATVRLAVADADASGEPLKIFARSLNTNLVFFWKLKAKADPAAADAWEPTDQTNFLAAATNPELLLAVAPGTLGAATLRLSAVDDDGNAAGRLLSVTAVGPVQYLVEAAGEGGTVRLPAGVYRDRLELSGEVTLEGGPGAVLDAGGLGAVVRVAGGARVTLRDLTLRGGAGGIVNHGELVLERVAILGNHAAGGGAGVDNSGTLSMRDSLVAGNTAAGAGGGLRNRSPGSAHLENSTFHGNRTTDDNGGAIANEGTLLLLQVTLSGNFAAPAKPEAGADAVHAGQGGGLYNSGAATLLACTLVRNHARQRGGGLHNVHVLAMQSTILADNSGGTGPDGWGEVQSAGFNLVGHPADLTLAGDAQGDLLGRPAGLGPLANNGGPTPTHLPLSGSPAIDAGFGGETTHDQRGVARRVDLAAVPDAADAADIGAVEHTPLTPARVTAAAALDAASHVAAVSFAVRTEEAVSGLAFTLRYPAVLLRPLTALPGPDAATAAFELDAGVSQPGRLGVRARFPAGHAAARDGRRVLHVVFEAIRELHDPAQIRLEFADDPAPRSAADAAGTPMPALFPPFVEAVAAAPPRLTVRREAGGRVAVSLAALPGVRGGLEAGADLENWTPLGPLAGADGPAVFLDETHEARRFYRWRLWTPYDETVFQAVAAAASP